MRICDWSSDVCSSDLVDGPSGAGRGLVPAVALEMHLVGNFADRPQAHVLEHRQRVRQRHRRAHLIELEAEPVVLDLERPVQVHAELAGPQRLLDARSEEHTSELQSLMRISYSV